MAANYPVNPRIRAYGKARIDMAERAKTPEDWNKLWIPPSNTFPLVWGDAWKHCVEYKVDDFAAEVGFYIDVLGFQVNAFNPGYAMFTSPQGEFFFAVVPTPPGDHPTPTDAIRLQFMVKDILATTRELEKRGIVFDQAPEPIQPGSSLLISDFRTPNGITLELWGINELSVSPSENSGPRNQDGDVAENGEEEDDEYLEGDEVLEDDEGEIIEDEDSDVDETGVAIDDEDEDDDEPISDEDEPDDEDEDDEEEELIDDFEDDDMDDDDLDDFDLDEDDDDEDERG